MGENRVGKVRNQAVAAATERFSEKEGKILWKLLLL
jgi:hypothetical protein